MRYWIMKLLGFEKDLIELDRWRQNFEMHRRWLAEFDDVCDALQNLKNSAQDKPSMRLCDLRASIRFSRQKRK